MNISVDIDCLSSRSELMTQHPQRSVKSERNVNISVDIYYFHVKLDTLFSYSKTIQIKENSSNLK